MHEVALLGSEVVRELDAWVVGHLVVRVERVDDGGQVRVVEARLAVLGDVGREDLRKPWQSGRWVLAAPQAHTALYKGGVAAALPALYPARLFIPSP